VAPSTYLLVVLSAVTHAYWNFLLKRSGATQTVVGLSKIVEAGAFGLVLLSGITASPMQILNVWRLPLVGALLVLLNYLFLSAAYRAGELSLVYPIARGAMLMFLPPLAFVTIGERLQPVGWAAIVIIIAGIAALRGNGRGLSATATSYAILAALTAACYTIWDKHAIQELSPLAYYAAYTVIVGIAYGLVLLRAAKPEELRTVWRAERNVIIRVGALNSGSYLLTLAALQTGQASYVIAVRQLSIAVGALLGWRLLGESLPPAKRAGIVLLVTGCLLLALTR
jgi:uncharacterized membrane protein